MKRLRFARNKLISFIPLSPDVYDRIQEDKISYIDQLIYRFTKLQDTMGDSLFPAILQCLEEDPEQMAMLDILNRLEKLTVINSVEEWVRLCNLRNEFTHEYDDNLEENSRMVNSLYHEAETLYKLFLNIKQFVQKKIFPYIPDKEMTRFDFDTPELH